MNNDSDNDSNRRTKTTANSSSRTNRTTATSNNSRTAQRPPPHRLLYSAHRGQTHAAANANAREQLLPYFNRRGITAVPPGAYAPSEIVSQIIRNYPECV
jgi:hypothetical protein